MYYIYLDDLRTPKTDKGWIVCRDVEAFKAAIEKWWRLGGPCDLNLSFDHDLGDDTPSGYDAMKWFVEFLINLDANADHINVNVHSANPVGKKNIEAYWESFKRMCEKK